MALPGEIIIRPLEDLDFTAFMDVQRSALVNAPEAFGSDYNWFDTLSVLSKEQRFARYINFPYMYLLAAFHEEAGIVGMIGFSTEHSKVKFRHKAKVWGMYVEPSYRGAGIASDLMNSVVETASQIGCEQIQLSVGTKNHASYGLYLRLGFAVYGTEARSLKVGEEYIDEYQMVKFLR